MITDNRLIENHICVLAEKELIMQLESQLDFEKVPFRFNFVEYGTHSFSDLTTAKQDLFIVDYRVIEQEAKKGSVENILIQLIPFVVIGEKLSMELKDRYMSLGAADILDMSELSGILLRKSVTYALSKHQSHQLLLAERERYSNLFNQSLDPVALFNYKFVLVDANTSYWNLMGELESGKPWELKDVFQTDDEYHNLLSLLKLKDFVKNYNSTIKTNDGEFRTSLLSISLLQNTSDLSYFYQMVIHDISEIEDALIEKRAAEKLSLTGKFMRMMAHEVRNPLTNVNLAAEQLTEMIQNKELEDSELFLEIILRNSKRINNLLNELLELSKPRQLNFGMFSVKEVMDKALSFVNDRIIIREIELELDIAEDYEIKADLDQLAIAILNILTNAVEAMESVENPKLVISCCNSEVENQLDLRISDNGIGMSEEALKLVFEPFNTGKEAGLGIGMTTTQNIIYDHKGRIKVDSTPNEGTTFTLTFPVYIEESI